MAGTIFCFHVWKDMSSEDLGIHLEHDHLIRIAITQKCVKCSKERVVEANTDKDNDKDDDEGKWIRIVG